MPCDYKNYPIDWKTKIRPDILERAKHCCEFCAVPNLSIGFRNAHDIWVNIEKSLQGDSDADDAREDGFKIIKIVLTIAHLDNDTKNNDYSNLRALCQRCHNRLDVPFRNSNRKKTLIEKKKLQTLF